MKNLMRELRTFFVLWSTQSLSQLGSAMTNFALTLWLYQRTGSALQTAFLSICSYAPYVCMSIFAGALSDRWEKKKVMLACDTFAACCTVTVLVLLKNGLLAPWHMYLLNAVNGLMNTVQQPASDVAMTLITPKKHYQRTSGLRSFSNSLVTILNPVIATALFSLGGMDVVLRTTIPENMQGRVYSCRNTLQFFTIPIGFFLGGYMVDEICEPIMKNVSAGSMLPGLFGNGKGSGAAMVMFVLGVTGIMICLIFGKILRRYEFDASTLGM